MVKYYHKECDLYVCVRVCVRACVRACVCVCVYGVFLSPAGWQLFDGFSGHSDCVWCVSGQPMNSDIIASCSQVLLICCKLKKKTWTLQDVVYVPILDKISQKASHYHLQFSYCLFMSVNVCVLVLCLLQKF